MLLLSRWKLCVTVVIAWMCVGCTEEGPEVTALDGETELTLNAIMGSGQADLDAPDLLRSCDPPEAFAAGIRPFDFNEDGQLDAEEAKTCTIDVHASQTTSEEDLSESEMRHKRMKRHHLWRHLNLVYDADDSGAIESSERVEMLDDFARRCENRRDRFDADGNGEIDDEELAQAQAEHEARQEEHRQAMEERAGQCHRGETEGAAPEDGSMKRGPRGMRGKRGEHEKPGLPQHLIDTFDANADGTLDDSEMSALRDSLRERIREGLPLMHRMDKPAEGEEPMLDTTGLPG